VSGPRDEPDELVYLSFEDAVEILAAIIGGTATQAADQLRSRDALKGALGRPASYAHYEHADLALQATVLAHGIAESQPFLDGNKRTALIAMLTFLEINGYRVRATDRELADWIVSFGSGATPLAVADGLRPRLVPTGLTPAG
jgi:death-on-curing protein